jgi:hypothetical protein
MCSLSALSLENPNPHVEHSIVARLAGRTPLIASRRCAGGGDGGCSGTLRIVTAVTRVYGGLTAAAAGSDGCGGAITLWGAVLTNGGLVESKLFLDGVDGRARGDDAVACGSGIVLGIVCSAGTTGFDSTWCPAAAFVGHSCGCDLVAVATTGMGAVCSASSSSKSSNGVGGKNCSAAAAAAGADASVW